jgi:bifunctional non-homologous end joining protein LigD
LTNLRKPFWPEFGVTKGHLLAYYAEVSPVLLPHLHDRAMVMKRYPNGAAGDFFFMKRAPSPRPEWISSCSIEHASGNVIDFPILQDLASLLWVVNLGRIDLNQWYARCDDVDRPDYLHFDLNPLPGATFAKVREAALLVREALDGLDMPSFAKTSGSKGLHVYVPILRGPTQKQVWAFAKELATTLAAHRPLLLTAEYRIAKRPAGSVLIDYQPERVGSDPGLGLLGAAECETYRSHAGHLVGSEAWRRNRGLRHPYCAHPGSPTRRYLTALLENRGRFNLGRYL